MIGFSDYIGLELTTEEVLYIAGAASVFITGKGIRDVLETKKEGQQNESTQHRIDDSTHI
ncbi:hypothetical protein D3C73_1466810 [compost metagenome]